MKKVVLMAFILSSIFLGGCKKDPLTVREKIIGKWNYIKDGYQIPVGALETFDYDNIGACIEFTVEGDYIYSFDSKIVFEAKWELNEAENNIQLINLANNYTILKLTSNELVYYMDFDDANGNPNRMITYLGR